jgi:hypothetical protein
LGLQAQYRWEGLIGGYVREDNESRIQKLNALVSLAVSLDNMSTVSFNRSNWKVFLITRLPPSRYSIKRIPIFLTTNL